MSMENIRQRIPELDYETGLEYCGDEPSFYADMLLDYATNGRDITLANAYEAKDWKTYEIEVHALKSTSRMMGLTDFGDVCEKLQTAAGDLDASYIEANHGPMMDDYLKFISIIKEELD